ncbi:DUF2178 domain-containing protein [Halorientalis halophila]|uniref:DUF2178 domain-containing protein n=1 Tax=Halorientalis halophila TaxID=3108499 RepID=UPI00300B760A
MSTTHPIQRGQKYKRAILGLFAVAFAGFIAGLVLDQMVAGLAVYGVAAVAGVALTLYVQFGSSVRLLDEREQRIEERASHAVINLFAYVGVPTFATLFLLEATGYYEFGPTVSGVLYAFSAIYLVWGLLFTLLRYRT